MSVYVSERIIKPPRFGIRPLKQGRGNRLPFVIGFDSESEHSYPFTLQFSLPFADESDTAIVYIPRRKHAALHAFMDVVHRVCKERKYQYLIYGYNLGYEFTQLFHDFADDAKDSDDFYFHYEIDGFRYRLDVYKAKRYWMTIREESAHITIRVLDAFAFFHTSLASAARMLGLPPKLDAPLFRRRDWEQPEFQAYAKRDAYITRLLGEQIVSMHVEYDVRSTISAPHFAASVFRRRFLRSELEKITPHLEQYGLWSYHGGKNGYYRAEPQRIEQVYAYDIRSAYPEAMRALPDIETAEWESVGEYRAGEHAIYRATIDYQPCRYRGCQYADGQWIDQPGRINACLTGYELDAMVERGECRIIRCGGYIMRGDSGGGLSRYVDTFYAMKQHAADDTTRVTAKLFLNSLYGKFFQKVPIGLAGSYEWESGNYIASASEQAGDWEAGGLYHPPIASLITGFVRAKIHRLEHQYSAIMTSTDGIFAMQPPEPSAIGERLGMLDVSRGTLRIWRERLYIYDVDDGTRKWAAHGFRGSVDDLERIPLERGRYEYDAQQVITLGMSTRRFGGERYQPGAFVMLPFGLEI